ncbi:hypothetical protein TVAG_552630 [Trichomonas vaginalis G3]|uniref:Uncharacterized protein n=1 Tax=Trichomonas vaginalis (strain ATCC PRA-98 / G3) TaxID=412133 RepID=A2HRS2_TRIV3|nr:hypothetical protein TVAG_552630 [Trichomonas vaginalis G3]|eukprot:XP_001280825.1 hypothetical protein [Trichomonas vaginalis G3]
MSSSSSSREPSPSMKQSLPNDYGAPIEIFLRAAQWQRAVSPRLGCPQLLSKIAFGSVLI